MGLIKKKLKLETFLLCAMILAFVFSVLLSFIYLKRINKKLSMDFVGIQAVLSSDSLSNSSLLYTYNEKFTAEKIIFNTSKYLDTLDFFFPTTDSIVKRFRIDFGNNRNQDPFKVESFKLIFEDDEIYLPRQEVFKKLENSSASINLDKNKEEFKFNNEVKPFDPYIIFSPLVEFTINKKCLALNLLLPFIILGIITFIIYRKRPYFNLRLLLPVAFIACIPLKIAWTTFFGLLLGVYGLISIALKIEKIDNWYLAYFFSGNIILLLILGRPSGVSDFDMQLGLFLWALVGVTARFPKKALFRAYIWFFMFFHAIIIASSVGFLFSFSELYGLELADFFQKIKLYSREIRNWLYYDHAAFLSFFGTVGVLFLHKLYKFKEIKLASVLTYHLLLISFIFFTATRIGFAVYLLILLNVLFSSGYRIKLGLNTIFLITFATVLFSNIGVIDNDRAILWNTSWDAIKERPFFGHGLGKSNEILQKAFENKDGIGLPLLELNHSHNQYLTYLLELGFLGTAILLIALVYFVLRSKQFKNEMFMVYLFAVGLLFLSESALQTSKPLYVLAFLFIFIFSKPKAVENQNRQSLKVSL